MGTTCRYCLVGKRHQTVDGGPKIIFLCFEAEGGFSLQRQSCLVNGNKRFLSSFQKLELPCGRVWTLSQCSTLPPWLLQKWPALQISHLDRALHACLARVALSVFLCAEQQHFFSIYLVKLEKTFLFPGYTAILWSKASLGLSPNPRPNKWKSISWGPWTTDKLNLVCHSLNHCQTLWVCNSLLSFL